DAAVVVLDHRGERQAVSVRAPRELPLLLFGQVEILDRHDREAVLRADVHAAAAQDALLRVVDRLDVADEAARGLAASLFVRVPGLALRDSRPAADVQGRGRLAVEDLEAGDHPVERRGDLLNRELRDALPRFARQVAVDRAGRALAVGDRLDQVARA